MDESKVGITNYRLALLFHSLQVLFSMQPLSVHTNAVVFISQSGWLLAEIMVVCCCCCCRGCGGSSSLMDYGNTKLLLIDMQLSVHAHWVANVSEAEHTPQFLSTQRLTNNDSFRGKL